RKHQNTDVAHGLAIIQQAMTDSAPESLCDHGGNCPYDTLAWAQFANGNYDEAIAASERALELSPADMKTEYAAYLKRLREMVATARSEGT
ncbi:MAG: tetratricopeptide repeat protein, partial [Planctomycetes bacterium]|nr:tetratricopeptide repeat protein [Planctomycetota bacterium]